MKFDELEELRKRLEYNSELEDEEIEKLWELIDEAITRQSAMEFDELISNGQLTKAARLFAKEYYDSGRMGHTRKLLIERLADKCDKYDAEIALQQYQPWIPISERLPEKKLYVLTYRKNGNSKVLRFENDCKWYDSYNEWETDVTHWKPLPEPPNQMRKEKSHVSKNTQGYNCRRRV